MERHELSTKVQKKTPENFSGVFNKEKKSLIEQ